MPFKPAWKSAVWRTSGAGFACVGVEFDPPADAVGFLGAGAPCTSSAEIPVTRRRAIILERTFLMHPQEIGAQRGFFEPTFIIIYLRDKRVLFEQLVRHIEVCSTFCLCPDFPHGVGVDQLEIISPRLPDKRQDCG